MIEKILMYDGPLQKIVPDENKNFEQIIFLDGKFGWTINKLKIKEFHQRKQKYWCISNVENIYLIFFLFVLNSSFSYFNSYKQNLIIADSASHSLPPRV